MRVTNYENAQELAEHADSEGGWAYFFVHYTSPDAVTIGGDPLPPKVIEAINKLREGIEYLERVYPYG